jgi:hypothetical protein
MSKKHRDRLTPGDVAAMARYEKTLPDIRIVPPPPAAGAPDIRIVPPMTDAELLEAENQVLAAIQTPDPFLAEDMTFRPNHAITVTQRLHDYLNDFRKAHPNAALLQMIPTGPGSYTFVWEL